MDISRYESKLRELNATKFEELIFDIISREYGQYSGFQIEHIGKTHGKQTPAKGTPDIWFSYKKDNNKKNVFVEITTQTTQLFTANGKVMADLQKCKEKIQAFLNDDGNLKKIIQITKNSDSHSLKKRNIPKDYNPIGAYNFDEWRDKFDDEIKRIYENLHNELLYTNEQQDFSLAKQCFESINEVFIKIGE